MTFNMLLLFFELLSNSEAQLIKVLGGLDRKKQGNRIREKTACNRLGKIHH